MPLTTDLLQVCFGTQPDSHVFFKIMHPAFNDLAIINRTVTDDTLRHLHTTQNTSNTLPIFVHFFDLLYMEV